MQNKLFKPSDLYWALAWLAGRIYYSLLPVAAVLRCARAKGRLKFYFAKDRALTRKNLVALFGDAKTEEEIQRLVRRHYEFMEEYELIHRLPRLKSFSRVQHWPLEGSRHLDAALAQGRGAIVLIAHFGYARLIKHFLRRHEYKVTVVGARSSKRIKAEKEEKKRAQRFTAFRRFFYERVRISSEVLSERDLFADINVRPMMEVLKNNGVLVIEGDAQHAVQFVELPFLGHVYPFPTGFIKLAMASGAPALPAFAVEAEEGIGVKVVIGEPLPLEMNGNATAAVAGNLSLFARIFEDHVRQRPYFFKIWNKENWFEERRARSRKQIAKRFY